MYQENVSSNPTREAFHMIHANHGSRLLGVGLGLLFTFFTYLGANNRLFVRK